MRCPVELNLRHTAAHRLPKRLRVSFHALEPAEAVWSTDCMSDAPLNGRRLRVANLVGHFNRQALLIEIYASTTSMRWPSILKYLRSKHRLQ